jgi:hypothetical protein
MPETSGVLFDNVAVKGGAEGPLAGVKGWALALANIPLMTVTVRNATAADVFMMRLSGVVPSYSSAILPTMGIAHGFLFNGHYFGAAMFANGAAA